MLEKDPGFNWFLWLISISCLAVILGAFYFFYYQKDYDFIVEVACDPTVESCTERDCTNPDDCPPNGLSDFKRYSVPASDFEKCENEDCTTACEMGIIECELQECEEAPDYGEYCVSPETEVKTNTEEGTFEKSDE
jgi:hypothetical protein